MGWGKSVKIMSVRKSGETEKSPRGKEKNEGGETTYMNTPGI